MDNILERLNKKNPDLKILPVSTPDFKGFGRVHGKINTDKISKAAFDYACLESEGVKYQPSVAQLEEDIEFMSSISRNVYGGMPIQIGICYGHNTKLNGLEYHKGNELLVAATDLILLLGDYDDLVFDEDISFDTSNIKAFFVPEGSAVELFTSALHLAPVQTEDGGFAAVIILPRGTNEPLDYQVDKTDENRLLVAVNKWLIMHPDAASGNVCSGLKGDNITVNI